MKEIPAPFLLLATLLVLLPRTSSTQEAMKRTYTTQRITSAAPKIDGHLDDPCWNEGYWFDTYVQYMPVEGGEPSQPTNLKILYDADNLYVAIRAFDNEPGRIDRRAARRDQWSVAGDIVGLCLDSYFGHVSGFEFDISAAGTKVDLILMNNNEWDTSWNAVWEGKTALEDSAWTAEMRIPFSQLRYAQKEEQVWGLHAWRWINRLEEEDQFTLIRRNGPGHLYDMGYLRGLKGLPKSRQIEFLPYSYARLKTFPANELPASGHTHDWNSSAGLDGKIGISSNFTVDYTVNPDFGQVEADPSELNLSAYEVFYDEKRPFFLENRTMFDFNLGGESLFYSRRIGHAPSYEPEAEAGGRIDMPDMTTILGAAKLTGKDRNGLSVGLIESVTQKEYATLTSPAFGRKKTTVEPLSNYLVGRIVKEMDEGNTVAGAMLTAAHRRIGAEHLSFMNRSAYSGGVDLSHYLANKKYQLEVKLAGSQVNGDAAALQRLQSGSARYYQRPDAAHLDYDSTRTQLAGYGGEVEFKKGSYGHWRYGTGLSWKSPGFELNDLGFLRSADEIHGELELGWVENAPGRLFSRYTLELQAEQNWDFDRTALAHGVEFSSSFTFNNRYSIWGGTERVGRALDTRVLRGGPALHLQGYWGANAGISTDSGRKLRGSLHYYTHFFDDGYSTSTGITPGLSYKVTEAIQFTSELGLSHEREMLHFMGAPFWQGQPRYLLAALDRNTMELTLRFDCAISPVLTIQYYGSPYISFGKYQEYRRVVDPAAAAYDRMAPRITPAALHYHRQTGQVEIDENGDGTMDYSISRPDFNFREFRSNLVLRWEVRTGSVLYLVWSHDRGSYETVGRRDWGYNWDRLLEASGGNLFLAKFSYWFAI
ncbi:MAG TPA: DUF5916 domain-containing protein [bacterium]|nr:DUF5916 domain-containing protein [bacterium]HPR89027.1 DUF5916 domain-containing protein [bacterium]